MVISVKARQAPLPSSEVSCNAKEKKKHGIELVARMTSQMWRASYNRQHPCVDGVGERMDPATVSDVSDHVVDSVDPTKTKKQSTHNSSSVNAKGLLSPRENLHSTEDFRPLHTTCGGQTESDHTTSAKESSSYSSSTYSMRGMVSPIALQPPRRLHGLSSCGMGSPFALQPARRLHDILSSTLCSSSAYSLRGLGSPNDLQPARRLHGLSLPYPSPTVDVRTLPR